MAKAKKLPSGNWRVRAYSHTSADGVRHYESFTASTKQEAEMMAAQFSANKNRRAKNDLKVSEALDGYITAKANILSPSTIKNYRFMQHHWYESIANIKIKRLTSEDVQLFVSRMSARFSAKTVISTYELLIAAISFYVPDTYFRVSLPTAVKKTPPAPSSSDVMKLYNLASEWMKKCILLAAFGSLRRGEIVALKYGDIIDDSVYVHADIVVNENNEWVYKNFPKNQASVRYVKLPQKVIEKLGTGDADDFIINHKPDFITKTFGRLRKKAGINIRFHDLRHYYASIGAALNIPDIYIADFGGWRHNSAVMKSIYQGNIADISDKYSKQMTDYFTSLLDEQ